MQMGLQCFGRRRADGGSELVNCKGGIVNGIKQLPAFLKLAIVYNPKVLVVLLFKVQNFKALNLLNHLRL
jgi:hypothetical protein